MSNHPVKDHHSYPCDLTSPPPKLRRHSSPLSPSDSSTDLSVRNEIDVCPPHFSSPQPPTVFTPVSSSTTMDIIPDRSETMVGVKSISSGSGHTLLLTYSGDVYAWGCNDHGQVLYDGPRSIHSSVKLPLQDIVSISAGVDYSLALSSQGKVYGWGINGSNQINMSRESPLPITLINIPYNFKEVYCGEKCSFALTQEGQVIKWRWRKSFELVEWLENIVFISVFCNSFVAIDENGDFFCDHTFFDGRFVRFLTTKLPVTKYLSPKKPFQGSFLFDQEKLFVIDIYGDVRRFRQECSEFKASFNKLNTVRGLTNIVYISGFCGAYAAIDNIGNFFVWGELGRISDIYEVGRIYEPVCIKAPTKIEGISIGGCSIGLLSLIAYNKDIVWALGTSCNGSLRLEPLAIIGSEILGSFYNPKQPLDRMFSGLIKLVYWHYLNFLKVEFGNPPYLKARFYTKCAISKKVAQFALGVFNVHSIQKNPQDLNLNENNCDLRLRLTTHYNGPKVVNTRIRQLVVYYDDVDDGLQLLSFFPNVEVVKLGGRSRSATRSLNLAHLSNLKCLELAYPFIIEQLPTSLVKLLLKGRIDFTDLGYLISLKELVLDRSMWCFVTVRILKGQTPLPQSIIRLEFYLTRIWTPVNIEIHLPNLKELIIHHNVVTNITEQNFPSLRFIQLIQPSEHSLSNSPLSPTKLINQGLIKYVKPTKNQYLVELSCFPWLIQYPADRYLIDIFRDYVD
ncbi:hypothetical protein P9112_007052 [Eukaryota sp. TZLM1-RC]